MLYKILNTGIFLSGIVTLAALLTDRDGDNESWGDTLARYVSGLSHS